MRDYFVRLREEKGLSQQNVADKLGISRQYYQMIETGDRQKKMDLSIAGGLASILGVSLMEILKLECSVSTMDTNQ